MPHDIEHKLIESIYEVTIDLDKYLDLFALLEDEFMSVKTDEVPAENAALEVFGSVIESHVDKALTIWDMTQPTSDKALDLKQFVEQKTLMRLSLQMILLK